MFFLFPLHKPANRSIQLAYYMVLNSFMFVAIYFNWFLYDELSDVMSLQEKYFFNSMLATACLIHVYLHFSDPGFIDASSKQRIESLSRGSDENYCDKCSLKRGLNLNIGHCPVCMRCSFNRDHHCFWIDNCVAYLNHKTFMVYLAYLLVFFCYSLRVLYAKLNSLECKLSVFWLSRDKIGDSHSFSCLFDVYYSNSSRALLTLLFVQLVPLIFYLILLLIQQFLFVSLGFTQQQLFKMSQKNVRFSLAIFISDTFSVKTSFKNWFNLLAKFRNMSDILSSQAFEHLVWFRTFFMGFILKGASNIQS